MRFSAEWLSDAPNAAPEERATACELKIFISEQNVCFHLDGLDGQVYDSVNMPVYSLAEGLAHDWWSIFGARDKEYRLFRRRAGYAVPDVRFRFDGVSFEAWSNEYTYSNPDIRYWAGTREVMARDQAEEVLARFVDDVIAQLSRSGSASTGATLRWERVCRSRSDPEEKEFCEAAGALGLDPYSAGESETEFVERSADLFSGEPLIEFLAGLAGYGSRQEVLSWITKIETYQPYQSKLRELAPIAKQVSKSAASRPGERGWQLGYRRARATRRALGRDTSTRIASVAELAKLLGNKYLRRVPRVSGVRALVRTRGEDVHVYLRDRPSTPEARVSEVFSFARAMGDVICFPRTSRAVVNDLHEANRQAAGRAFAAEFLAPVDEVMSMHRDGKDIAAIADDLNVATEVVDRQIENRLRIAEACS